MPFKLKLKKSRHYSVVSKSLYVISIEMLDGTTVECTLSSESTGQDCLDMVCQKLGLNQPKFFGLQYQNRNANSTGDDTSDHTSKMYWVELDCPLKRQLDKYAKNLCVYLRVMYYTISGVRLLNDEITRYHYFLQLKMDVIEGRIVCRNLKQAIELASYSMQAEYGNYDSERHTADYLKDFQLFPKTFNNDPQLLEMLTDGAIRQHAALINLSQGVAEGLYICACQQLEGYGRELFHVKQRISGGEMKDVVICVSLTAITVKNNETIDANDEKHYSWSDIKNVINHKRYFVIETISNEKVEFQFSDVEGAKNAWRFCVLQHTFYRQYEMNNNETANEDDGNHSKDMNDERNALRLPVFQQARSEDKLRQIDNSYEDIYTSHNVSTQSLNRKTQSCHDLDKSTTNLEALRSLLPSYRPAPDYETAVRQKYQRNSTATAVAAAVATSHTPPKPRKNPVILYSSQPEIHRQSDPQQPQPLVPPPSSSYSFHYPDVTHNNIETSFLPDDNRIFYTKFYCNNSNSTPDLAKSSNRLLNNLLISGSSPDLLTDRFMKTYLQHGTYENLPSIFAARKTVMIENPNLKKMYDEHGNIIYCMPTTNFKHLLNDSSKGDEIDGEFRRKSNREEPIYENIPIQWHLNDNEMIRNRTQSVHSAPPEVNKNEQLYANIEQCNTTSDTPTENQLQNDYESSLQKMNTLIINQDKNVIGNINDSTCSGSSINNVSSNSSNGLNTKSKKKRWALLIGGGSSKSKSATLERNEKKDKNNKSDKQYHRWSTGLPRFNPLPPSISKEMMCQLLENKLSDSQLFFEFDKIPKKKPNADFTTALHPDNQQFNRFKDVLPYEDNRVRLTPTRNNRYGYINASHITATVGSKQRFYIAAQGPTKATLPYFWQCVWEAEVYLIVQLTDTNEDLDYMPNTKQRSIDIGQDYQVLWEFSQKSGHCLTSKIRLCHVTSRRYRTLWHLHYIDWSTNGGGCPHSVAHFLGFCEEMQSVHQHSMCEIPPGHNKNPPILVHCTAGVGRTGLTILSDLLLYTVDHNQEVCIPRVVGLLRHQRAFIVQTIMQYRFVYTLLIHYLKQTRLI